ncbi:MAG TPA: hypothetical protein PK289_00950 [Bacteroidia bacterium]|nr:hypothetical protein [Bacteroidia bacterium]
MSNNQVQLTPEMINRSETLLCVCGHHFFVKKTLIKKIPSIMIGQFNYANLEISFCEKCGAPADPNNQIDYPGKEEPDDKTEFTDPGFISEPGDKSILPGVSDTPEGGGMKIME